MFQPFLRFWSEADNSVCMVMLRYLFQPFLRFWLVAGGRAVRVYVGHVSFNPS